MSFLFRCLRQLLTALWVLLGLYCICEVSVRLYDARTGKVTQHAEGDPDLIVKSWTMHHELKPLQKVVRKSDGNRRVTVQTNSRGFRGADPMIPKPENIYRVVCLGDERVLGPHVADGEIYSARLEKLLQHWTDKFQSGTRIEVINAGVPDYCPLLSLLQFQHSLAALQPDLVLLNFDMSDVADDYRFRRHVVFDEAGKPLSCIHPGLEIRKLAGNQLVNEVLLIPRWGKQVLVECWTSRLFSMPQTNISSSTCKYLWLDDQAPDWSIHIRQSLEPLKELQKQCLSSGADFVVTMCPSPFQVSDLACNDPRLRERVGVAGRKVFKSEQPFQIVFEYCKENRIALCDATPPFLNRDEGEKLYLRHAVEMSPEGHSLLARSVAVYLVKNFPTVWQEQRGEMLSEADLRSGEGSQESLSLQERTPRHEKTRFDPQVRTVGGTESGPPRERDE